RRKSKRGDAGAFRSRAASRLAAALGWCVVAILVMGCGSRGSRSESLGSSAKALRPGTVAAYGFEEGSGTTTANAAGQGLGGTLTNATWERGKFGNALRFNASDTWVTVDDAPALELTTGMTLSAWVRPRSELVTWPSIIFKEQLDDEN